MLAWATPRRAERLCRIFSGKEFLLCPEYDTIFSGIVETRFITLDALSTAESQTERVVFLDDFVGTGKQAIRFLNQNIERFPWLRKKKLYIAALLAFEDAQRDKEMFNELAGFYASEILKESMRAFSPQNPIWESASEREEAKAWAEEIGREVLPKLHSYEPSRDALGYDNTQAIVSFGYNIPNNTLPLFWAAGQRGGKEWRPLRERFD